MGEEFRQAIAWNEKRTQFKVGQDQEIFNLVIYLYKHENAERISLPKRNHFWQLTRSAVLNVGGKVVNRTNLLILAPYWTRERNKMKRRRGECFFSSSCDS